MSADRHSPPGDSSDQNGHNESGKWRTSFSEVADYLTDMTQRSVLFWDVMRQRGNQYREHQAKSAPHVLEYGVELLIDGRTLARPVNYALVRVVPPADVEVDPTRRPFVVVDPRAGHGPGIGGFKADSEIGVAFKAGHPCYFVGFFPEPVPGQTIEDIARAEAVFLEKVLELHPDADGKPCVIGNCQAGWALMILAALRPELFGPIIVAGTPLSYWAGVRGQNPLRYLGGLLGGSWLAALSSDLGNGKFDGAHLVQNFENLNPSNTLWSKQYNLYSKIDTEAPRYLGFERWWGGHVTLNADEIQFIVDELFIGNKLAAGLIKAADGTPVDLRSIRSPIVVFCSKGDNITPPQQALGWILDLYDSVDEIRSYGQTIVYTIHETVGHLGIFVSSGVARKEHGEFSSNIDLIDTLPPGLYEATFQRREPETDNPELVGGDWIMRCEMRTLDDIRALGGNSIEDERRFEAVARISDNNLALYRRFAQPWIRAFVNEPMADAMRRLHPLRLQYELFSDANPFMTWIGKAAETVRQNRRPLDGDNSLMSAQERFSRQAVVALDAWRDMTERASERLFTAVYGLPTLQAAVGIDPTATAPIRKAPKNPQHRELTALRLEQLRKKIKAGGIREAVMRSALYIGMARSTADERTFSLVRRLRETNPNIDVLTLPEFKAALREQYYILLMEPAAALAALPSLLPVDPNIRSKALAGITQVVTAVGSLPPEAETRLQQIKKIFERGPVTTEGGNTFAKAS